MKVRIRPFRRHVAGLALAAALIAGTTACEETTPTTSSSSSSEKESGGGSDAKPKEDAPKSTVEEFKAYVQANGTGPEKEAAGHVTKIIGADKNQNILDTAEIHTDYTGGIMDVDSGAAGNGKLLATVFAEFQKSRGMDSKNGLVSVYNGKGELISNGEY